jgi:hypothetical protein
MIQASTGSHLLHGGSTPLVALRSWFSDAKMATTDLLTLMTLKNALHPD